MAKKGGSVSFSDIGKIVEGAIGNTSIVIEDPKTPSTREFIPTGNYLLNALLSKSILDGGILSNRITAFAGEEGVGKSFLCYNIAREAQKKGWNVIYIDTEFSIELDNLTKFGIEIDKERFMLIRSNVIEDLKIFLTKTLNQMKELKDNKTDIPKTIIFLDSVGQLASRKEVEDALKGSEKADMTRAKTMGSLFRIISSDLGYLNVPMVVTNHTYSTTDLFPQEVMKGGRALYYAASTIAFITKAKLKTGEEDDLSTGQSGIIATIKAKKNRIAKPKKIKIHINFTKGWNPYTGLEHFCIPEFFENIGIGKGKMEVDRETGEEIFKPGGIRWYVRHLGKSIFEKQLHTPEVFTDEVLNKLEPIIYNYFEYADHTEIDKMKEEFNEMMGDSDDDVLGVDMKDLGGEDLFE
jgi:RecA/RadA recombinase